jgi:hypothetical protein
MRSWEAAISFTGKNTNQFAPEWSGDRLDQKISNGEEVYIAFDKSRIKTNLSYLKGKAASPTQFGVMDWPEIIVLAAEPNPKSKSFKVKRML